MDRRAQLELKWERVEAPAVAHGPYDRAGDALGGERVEPEQQGLTLVHFSAQLEPCLTQTLTPNTLLSPEHILNMGYIIPTRPPLSHDKRLR